MENFYSAIPNLSKCVQILNEIDIKAARSICERVLNSTVQKIYDEDFDNKDVLKISKLINTPEKDVHVLLTAIRSIFLKAAYFSLRKQSFLNSLEQIYELSDGVKQALADSYDCQQTILLSTLKKDKVFPSR